MTAGWSTFEYVANGRFSHQKDLDQAVRDLARASQGVVFVAVFSRRYMLPSLSRLTGDFDGQQARDYLAPLQANWGEVLRDQADPYDFVSDQVRELMAELGVAACETWRFGGDLSRTGSLGVVVGARACDDESDLLALAEHAAACAYGSRPAMFHRLNSQDLAVVENYKKARDQSALTDDAALDVPLSELGPAEDEISRRRLGWFHRGYVELLDIDALVVYELDGDSLRRTVPADAWPALELPEGVEIDIDAKMPLAPELGGSNFASLAEPVNLAWINQRKYFADIGHEWHSVTWPFGHPVRGGGSAGVVAVVWSDRDIAPLGAHDLSQIRSIVQLIDQELAYLDRSESVEAVASVLREISNYQPIIEEDLDIPRGRFFRRKDIKRIRPTVRSILDFLVLYTDSIAATCRILSGDDSSDVFERGLIRVDWKPGQTGTPTDQEQAAPEAEAEESARRDASPETISLSDYRTSANAWVAVHGRHVHLPEIESADTDTDYPPNRPRHLDRYPDLDEIAIYRDIGSELCVPIFAENRLVGTINIESKRKHAYDTMVSVVAECAHAIGVALLASRRHIGVELMMDVGGFLDRRHELDRRLHGLRDDVLERIEANDSIGPLLEQEVEGILTLLYQELELEIQNAADEVTLVEVIGEALKLVKFMNQPTDLREFAAPAHDGSEDDEFEQCLATKVGRECANALKFAVAQSLVNVRKFTKGPQPDQAPENLFYLHVTRRMIGGRQNLYVGMRSAATATSLQHLVVEQVFREPLDFPGEKRTRMGNYIAGELLRRCGGSAFMRREALGDDFAWITVEFGIPVG